MKHHTLSIFKRLRNHIPPLAPDNIGVEMENAIKRLSEGKDTTLVELEDAMIMFGKKLWPYLQAFGEFVRSYEDRVGKRAFLGHVSENVVLGYKQFELCGGSWQDFHNGKATMLFDVEDRLNMLSALIYARDEARKHAVQAVLSVDRPLYLKKISVYTQELFEIEAVLNRLREMAEQGEFSSLRAEINANARAIEYGFCFLGPKISHSDVIRAPEYFVGRRIEKN